MTPTLAVTGSNLCSDAPFSVALELDGAVTSAAVPAGERGDLARLCDELCRARGLQPAQLRRVVLDVGPGSYTGLRVAVTFVRLLQQFGDVQVEGVCSLAALARLAVQGDAGRVRTVLDARRGRLHTAVHELGAGRVVEREAARAAPVDEVLAAIAPGDAPVAPAAFAEELGRRGLECVAARGWTAANLLRDGLPRFAAAPADLEPRYLMASYAED